jgi:hypothetical protein
MKQYKIKDKNYLIEHNDTSIDQVYWTVMDVYHNDHYEYRISIEYKLDDKEYPIMNEKIYQIGLYHGRQTQDGWGCDWYDMDEYLKNTNSDIDGIKELLDTFSQNQWNAFLQCLAEEDMTW